MRLIDADVLIEEANIDGAYGYVDAIQIANTPTLTLDDIVPHGRWIDSKRTSDSKCSVCKEWVIWTGVTFAYCPNCGAKMDLDNYLTPKVDINIESDKTSVWWLRAPEGGWRVNSPENKDMLLLELREEGI